MTNELRKQIAINYLKGIQNTSLDNLVEGTELTFIIKQITVFPENMMDIAMVDGKKVKWILKPYTPSKGWRSSDYNYMRNGGRSRNDC